MKGDLYAPQVFGGWQSPLWGRTHLPSDWSGLKMQRHNLIQQRSHPSKEIPLRQPFQGLKGNLRKMALIGEMKSQMEDGRKKDGRGREEKRRRLQKENK